MLARLKDPQFLAALNRNNEVAGYASPSGRITYNKIVNKRSFAAFTDIIASIVPLEIVNDPDQNHKLPSIAKVLNYQHVYRRYLYLNATMDEYMDYEDEEDQENMTDLLEFVHGLPVRTAVVGITIQKSEAMGSAHASAFIVWRASGRKYKFAFYDPLAHRKGKKAYDYAERAFVASRFEEKIEFINLNTYCYHKVPEEFHCSQYIINAEYCYIYSLYFLHKWIEFGGYMHRGSFRKAIKSTYIVEPDKLTRADNRESMIYRVVMMEFVCRCLLKYLKGLGKIARKYIVEVDTNVKRIEEYLAEFKELYGFELRCG